MSKLHEHKDDDQKNGGTTLIEWIVLLSIIVLLGSIIYFDRKYSSLQINLENKNCVCLESM